MEKIFYLLLVSSQHPTFPISSKPSPSQIRSRQQLFFRSRVLRNFSISPQPTTNSLGPTSHCSATIWGHPPLFNDNSLDFPWKFHGRYIISHLSILLNIRLSMSTHGEVCRGKVFQRYFVAFSSYFVSGIKILGRDYLIYQSTLVYISDLEEEFYDGFTKSNILEDHKSFTLKWRD